MRRDLGLSATQAKNLRAQQAAAVKLDADFPIADSLSCYSWAYGVSMC